MAGGPDLRATSAGATEGQPRGSRARAVWCVAALSLLIAPNVAAVVTPFERWPFTCGPMFAEDPGAAVRYRPRFVLERHDGTTATLPARQTTGLAERWFRRAFLTHAWGSDGAHSFLAHDDDAVANGADRDAARAARVAGFFDGVVAAAQQKKKLRAQWRDVVAVRVEVVDVDAAGAGARLLGRYDLATKRFVIDAAWRRP